MANSKENRKEQPGSSHTFTESAYRFLCNLQDYQEAHPSLSLLIRLLNSILTLLIYLSLPTIGLISLPAALENSAIISLCCVGFIVLIWAQLLLGIMYNKQLFLKVQLSLYRNVILYVGIFGIAGQGESWQHILLVLCLLLFLGCSYMVGKEGYWRRLLQEEGLPLDNFTLLFQIFLCYYRAGNSYKILFIFMMLISAIITRFIIFSHNYRRCRSKQYTLLKIQSSLHCIYILPLLFSMTFYDLQIKGSHLIYSFFLLMVCVITADIISESINKMPPLPAKLFNEKMERNMFMNILQYVIDDVKEAGNDSHISSSNSGLLSFYYQHYIMCKHVDCPVSHELLESDTQKSGGKALAGKVFRVAERIFLEYLRVFPEDISIKFSLISFYMQGVPNKFKVLQIITELETLQLSWMECFKIFSVKRQLAEMEVMELFENLKMDEVDEFNENINRFLRLLVDFWVQFMEERVDFNKVVQLGEKLTSAMETVEQQWIAKINSNNFTNIKGMKMYAEYCRCILNDKNKNQVILDYLRLLNKKLSESHELHYLSSDSETGIVAISLNGKKLGSIKLINNQAARIFNYQKSEMEKLRVNDLMPLLYSQHHDEFLKVFLTYENKKVNTDNRLLLGKKNDGSLFYIYLQLHKSLTTASQEMIFIASIETAKVSQTQILAMCNEQGHIVDNNSTFVQIFNKNTREKYAKPISNIQELIPNFFESLYEEEIHGYTTKTIKQTFDSSYYGVIEISFEISRISFPNHEDVGYLIKGTRVEEEKKPLFEELSLTEALDNAAEYGNLQGMKMRYNYSNNEYLINGVVERFDIGEFGSQFTIPYMKINQITGVLRTNFDQSQKQSYDSNIKTIRFCKDHFERVEEPESFESELDSEEKKTHAAQDLEKIKSEMNTQVREKPKQSLRLCNLLITLLLLCSLIILYTFFVSENSIKFVKIDDMLYEHNFRGELAEYVSYFEGQKILPADVYFSSNKEALKDKLINSIFSSKLPQNQKEKAYKIAYLEKQGNLTSLIHNDVFAVDNKDNGEENSTLLPLYLTFFCLAILIKIIFSVCFLSWQRKELLQILTLFLSLSEKSLRKAHKNCLALLKNSTDMEGEQMSIENPILAEEEEPEDEEDDQNPHIKLKKFKNLTAGVEIIQVFKINIFVSLLIAITIVFASVSLTNIKKAEHEEEALSFVITVMPEYSVRIMKSYFLQANETVAVLSEQFNEKYQFLEFDIANENLHINNTEFMQWLYDDVCSKFDFELPQSCQSYVNGILNDGISKMMNWISSEIKKIDYSSSGEIESLKEISLILFKIVKPVIEKIEDDLHKQFQVSLNEIKTFMMIFFIAMIAISLADFLYSHNYPLKTKLHNLQSSRSLVRLLPNDEPQKKKQPNQYSL